jgi:hypothetical protein
MGTFLRLYAASKALGHAIPASVYVVGISLATIWMGFEEIKESLNSPFADLGVEGCELFTVDCIAKLLEDTE